MKAEKHERGCARNAMKMHERECARLVEQLENDPEALSLLVRIAEAMAGIYNNSSSVN